MDGSRQNADPKQMIPMEETLIPINIIVGDRSYRLKIRPDEEEFVRRVMREVNEKILTFKSSYAGKDMQDYIAMCLITYSTQSVATQAGSFPADFQERLQSLEDQLDKALE